MAHKTAILERYVDIDRLFGPYTWDTLLMRYLRSYTDLAKLQRVDEVARKRDGRPWPDAATAARPER